MNRQNSQEVCPWNSPKLVQTTTERDYLPRVPRRSGTKPDRGTGTHSHPHTQRKSKRLPAVVFLSSVAALQGVTFHASMGMAKGAVSGLTLALAAELAPKIRVNAVAPSLLRTPLSERILAAPGSGEAIARQHAAQRLGTAGDVASAVAFLLSEEADWITGQIVPVDGGRSSVASRS